MQCWNGHHLWRSEVTRPHHNQALPAAAECCIVGTVREDRDATLPSAGCHGTTWHTHWHVRDDQVRTSAQGGKLMTLSTIRVLCNVSTGCDWCDRVSCTSSEGTIWWCRPRNYFQLASKWCINRCVLPYSVAYGRERNYELVCKCVCTITWK